MRRFLSALFFLALTFYTGMASAAISADLQNQITGYFSMLGSNFGCAKLVRSAFNQTNLAQLEFIPTNENAMSWTKGLSVTVQVLPEDETLVFAAMNSYNATVMGQTASKTALDQADTVKAKDGTPITYIEYQSGAAYNGTHTFGLYGRHTQNFAAYVKFIDRSGQPNTEARATMKRMMAMLATRQ